MAEIYIDIDNLSFDNCLMNPLTVAKIVGGLMIIVCLFLIWGLGLALINNDPSSMNVSIAGNKLPTIFGFVPVVIMGLIAFGLFKTKRWSVYLLTAAVILNIVTRLKPTEHILGLLIAMAISNFIPVLIAAYLFKNRAKFSN